MRVHSLRVVLTGVAFLLVVSASDLRAAAAGSPDSGEKLHAVAAPELHAAVRAASAEAQAARTSLGEFLAQDEVRSQIEQAGLDPAAVASQVALLSDSEILQLQSQVMTEMEQLRTAGLRGWIIAVIVLAGILLFLLIMASTRWY